MSKVEFADWAGRYLPPACMKLYLYLSGSDGKKPCAMLEGWRPGNAQPGEARQGDTVAHIKTFPIRQMERDEALAWAAAMADEHGYPLILLKDDLPPRE
ncbi:MAG: hypothetical protein RLO51_07685 [Thalassobaculum sp.]|uniref:hypothetical protein n=1 Tax=Thalassobaculum sp. TaxID=2022740 RepID=UPI0032ED6D8A